MIRRFRRWLAARRYDHPCYRCLAAEGSVDGDGNYLCAPCWRSM